MRATKQGFTLIELLVVIATIGILVSILVPASQSVRLSAQQVQCASNMRQIGIGLLSYASDNEFALPETAHTAFVDRAWIYALAPYLGDLDEIRICPADPKGEQRLAAGGTSYVLNSFLFVPQVDGFGMPLGGPSNNLLLINNPADTMMAFIVSDFQSLGDSGDHTHSNRWTTWSAVTTDITPDRFTRNQVSNRSNGVSNYLYADGHVESHEASAMMARIQSGDNFAEPR